ncbi:MAG: DUF2249 domain-containing protein [Pseudolabrys sp.]|nr:DUF2249 domain-containing protein [Pseudolabrys sp.]
MSGARSTSVLDARTFGPRHRLAPILHTFHTTKSCQEFVPVNNRLLKRFNARFKAEYEGSVTWDYPDRGRDVGRISLAA